MLEKDIFERARHVTATAEPRLFSSRQAPIRQSPTKKPNLRCVAPYEVVVDGIKVYQSQNGRNSWTCLVYTDETRRQLWWTQSLEDFAPAEQDTVAALVKAKYGFCIDPL